VLVAVLMQGFSAGGEFGTATAYLVEQNAGRRGFMGSWQTASQAASTLLVTVVIAVLSGVLEPAQFDAWGWRVPFAVGLLLGPVGIYIRRHLQDSPEFTAARIDNRQADHPLRTTLRHQKSRMALTIGVIAVSTGLSYLISYMPTFAIRELGLPASTSFTATILTGVVLTVGSPLAGHLSDRIGRIRMISAAGMLIFLVSVPCFLLIRNHPTVVVLTAVLALLGMIKVWYSGPLATFMAEIFPVQTRGTGLSISYSLGVALFGGLTPLVVTWLIAATGSKLAPGFWIMLLAVLSTTSVLLAGRYVRATGPVAEPERSTASDSPTRPSARLAGPHRPPNTR
jgi:MHS family proline/betaine transporter-like MFS transporter